MEFYGLEVPLRVTAAAELPRLLRRATEGHYE
jgi:hypothetical protein